MDEPTVDLRILGSVRLTVNGKAVHLEPRQATVLAIIAAAGGKVASTELARRLGVDGSATLRSYRARLRASAGFELVGKNGRSGLQLVIARDAVDLWRFRTGIGRCVGLPAYRKLPLLREATDCWQGLPLADLDPRWVRDEVSALHAEGRRAFLELIKLSSKQEGAEHTAVHAKRAGDLFPHDDEIRAELWQTWARCGRSSAIADDLRRRLELPRDLGSLSPGLLRKEAKALIAQATRVSTAVRVQVPHPLPWVRSKVYGRDAEFDVLDTLTDPGSGIRGVTVSGLGGLGKTELVVEWGHRVAAQFPDGVLFADMGGFSSSGPVRPEVVLTDFARQLGILVADCAGGGLLAAYRTAVNTRAILVVIDNARDHQHVTELLAAGKRSRTIVTTRAAATMPAVAGGQVLALRPITLEASLEVLRSVIGVERTKGEPFAAAKLMAACGGIPLAVRLVAAQAQLNPGASLEDLVVRLGSASAMLGAKPEGETTLRDSLALSYAPLSAEAARVLQISALHPGPAIALEVIPFLSGLPASLAHEAVDELLRGSLLDPLPENRFHLHDLVRAFALERAVEELPAAEVSAVRERLLGWLLAAARLCDRALRSGRELPDDLLAAEGAPLPGPANEADGRRWFENEHNVLLAVLDSPDFTPFSTYRWRLPLALCCYHTRNGPWPTAERLLTSACEITKDELDEPERTRYQAVCHRVLGNIQRKLRKFGTAERSLAISITVAESIGDQLETANGHQQMSVLQEDLERWEAARHHATVAGHLYEDLADDRGVAATLPTEIHCHLELGEPERVLEREAFAVELMTRASTPYNRGALHRVLMDCHLRLERPDEAAIHGEAARVCYVESGAPTNEVRVLAVLALAYCAAGRFENELRVLRDFMGCYERLRQRDAEDRQLHSTVKSRLAELGA
ncbi:AfsR/SARP family transcriptional regulator [Amycolatopsis sp. H20-H5]|uniref:AfsR/SARP family transcriptional regulator n=1 Tax=Amycolatopsis sp. H20-H5 TaxID=3046309 RepID=UPI002DC0327C|nr:bacterial transcriptional activator domain-containing protein [Amycolatopsis sp. H20-H5]MEC3980454.1 bacterial transcriptional activator domain-containing protein [Amycolatopsis sp. H20-H5]